MAEHPSPLSQMSGMIADDLLTLMERTIQGALEPLQSRIEALERQVAELEQRLADYQAMRPGVDA